MTVWKYELLSPLWTIQMPVGAKILSLQYQGDQLCLWALVNPAAEKQPRRFQVFGTGGIVPADAAHIGTVQDGRWVWHVFEVAA